MRVSSASILQASLFLLFVISPFYLVPSIGGEGFDLPFNITVWFAATLTLGYLLWRFASQIQINLPRGYGFLLVLPAGILLSATIAGVDDSIIWFFRITYLLAGVLFLLGLFQVHALNTQTILLFIVLAASLFSLHGIIQIYQLENGIGDWMPRNNDLHPTSVFQQKNVLASFLATSLLISLSVLLKAQTQNPLLKIGLFLHLILASYVLMMTASRVGVLAFLVGIILLLIGQTAATLKQKKLTLLLSVALIVFGGFLGKAGLESISEKTYRLTAPEYAEQRYILYDVSFETIKASPILGHGIGSFWQSWYEAAVPWWHQHPVDNMPDRLSHPHNELLMWAVEGGLVALLSIVTSLLAVMYLIWRQHQKTAFVYFSLLFPISFHAMVELPFYHSALHWFVWLFLLFFALQTSVDSKKVNLSHAARISVKTLALLIVVTGSAFLYNTLLSQKEVVAYAMQKPSDNPLQHAMNNLYYADAARQMALRGRLAYSIEQQDQAVIMKTTEHLETALKEQGDLKLFADVITGYQAMGNQQKACEVAELGLQRNPWNQPLVKYLEQCQN